MQHLFNSIGKKRGQTTTKDTQSEEARRATPEA
jgi:hypothetical protein